MAKSNFRYEKRQRELAKKRKKEEKQQRKLEKVNPQPPESGGQLPDGPPSGGAGDGQAGPASP